MCRLESDAVKELRNGRRRAFDDSLIGNGIARWRRATLNGRFFALLKKHDWPARMPTEGILEVDFVSDSKIPEGVGG